MKVGDKVEILDLDGYAEWAPQGLVVGNTGTVTYLHDNGQIGVRTDNAEQSVPLGLASGWVFTAEALKVIE